MKKRTFIILALVMTLFLHNINFKVSGNNLIKLEYDGKIHNYNLKPITIMLGNDIIKTGDMPAILLDNRTLVPAREVFESSNINAKVEWNQRNKEVNIAFEKTKIKLKINNKTAYVNNNPIKLDVPPKLIRDTLKQYAKTMIPLRFIGETLDYNISWNQEKYRVLMTKSSIEEIDSNFSKTDTETNKIANIIDIKIDDNKDLTNNKTIIICADDKITSYKKIEWENKLIIDIDNASSTLKNNYIYDNSIIKEIRTSQYSKEPSITRIVLDMKYENYDYITQLSNDKKEIKIDISCDINEIESDDIEQIGNINYNNMSYNAEDKLKFKFKKPNNVTLAQLKTTDLYQDKKFIIEFPNNQSESYGSGELKINDSSINKFEFYTNNQGNTILEVYAKKVFTYEITEDDDNFILNIYSPKEKHIKVIVIDPGHGGNDTGAIGNNLLEKDVNLDIVKYLKTYLDNEKDIKVYYTRLDDTYPTLAQRSELANKVKADFFLSVHSNSVENASPNGTETLYYNDNNKKYANIMQKHLINNLKLKNRGLVNRAIYVLKNTNMPSALVEIAFLSNQSDAKHLKDEDFKMKAAKALYMGILEVLENK